MGSWLNDHYTFVIAFAAGFALRWAAMRFLAEARRPSRAKGSGGQFGADGAGRGGGGGASKAGKWTKDRFIKFVTLLFVFCAGLLVAYGAYPTATWIIGWGTGFGGYVGIAFGVAALAAGWHSLHGGVALVHDMTDGTPDDEAFDAGFWIPTTIPIGWGALSSLFANPRGLGTGLAVVAISAVTIVYAHKILRRTHAAKGHYRAWMCFSFVISIFVGIVHIAALAYLNQVAGEYLPPWAAWMIRAALVIAGIVFLIVGLADIFRDFIPEKWAQWAAMYTIPTFTVLAVSWATLEANASEQLNIVFGAFK